MLIENLMRSSMWIAASTVTLISVCAPVFAASAEAASPQKVEVYGVTVGEPFTVPPCAQNGSYDTYEAATDFTCFWTEKPEAVAKPDGELLIKFASPAAFTTTGTIGVVVLSGIVNSIEVETTGTDSGEQVLALIAAKIGRPISIHRGPIQNAFGAQFTQIEAMWKIGDVTVEFNSAPERIDEGTLTASTPAGNSFLDAKHHVPSTPV